MEINIRDMILVSLFAALTAIGAFIRIETPIVPFTLQFLFCAYSGIILGGKNGLYSQLLYVFIGLMGIPVFTHGGGPLYILQSSFGYLVGFIVCAYVIGRLTENIKEIKMYKILFSVLTGLFFVYLFGVIHLYLILNFYIGKPIGIKAAIVGGCLQYLLFDVILSIFVAVSSVYIIPALRKHGLIKNLA